MRNLPEQSPVVKRNTNLRGSPEDQPVLSEGASDHIHRTLTRLNARQPDNNIPLIPGKTRSVTMDDEILNRVEASQRPVLKRRPISAGAALADFAGQTEKLRVKTLGRDERLSSHDENSVIDSEYSKLVEERSGETSTELLVTHGTASPDGKKHVVISSYIAEETGEVSLEKGEEVDVLQKESSGWWYVKNDFCEGWAPCAFLAPARSRPPSPETPDQNHVSDSQEESCQIKETLDTCPKEEGAKERKFVLPKTEKVAIILISDRFDLPIFNM